MMVPVIRYRSIAYGNSGRVPSSSGITPVPPLIRQSVAQSMTTGLDSVPNTRQRSKPWASRTSSGGRPAGRCAQCAVSARYVCAHPFGCPVLPLV
jgi:hypothetical protein